jgi:hypothetical protein
MPGGSLSGNVLLPGSGVITGQADLLFTAVGHGDVLGNGTAEAIFQYSPDGPDAQTAIYYKSAGDIGHGFGVVAAAMPAGWQVVGVGDINGDGVADVVLEDTKPGDQFAGLALYADMKTTDASYAAAIANPHSAPSPATTWGLITFATVDTPAEWVVKGVGDVNGDGFADVIYQDTANGQTIYADAVHGTAAPVIASSALDASWVAKAVGDINGDGLAEVVYEQAATGTIIYAAHNTDGSFSLHPLASNLIDFDVRTIADVNNDGYGDVMMQYTGDAKLGAANLAGAVVYIDMGPTLHNGGAATLGLVSQSVGIGHDYVLV